MRYLAQLAPGKIVLWCFLLWYLVTVVHHFDATPAIWVNAAGIAAIICFALYLSVLEPGRPRPDRWTVVRLFLMPFCVSSFSQLIKGKGFVLVFPGDPHELSISAAVCAAFVVAVLLVKRLARVPA